MTQQSIRHLVAVIVVASLCGCDIDSVLNPSGPDASQAVDTEPQQESHQATGPPPPPPLLEESTNEIDMSPDLSTAAAAAVREEDEDYRPPPREQLPNTRPESRSGPKLPRSRTAQRETPSTTPSTAREPIARLSAGVALPQSLPQGTTMGFSADYELLGDLPSASGQVVWVIQTAHGRTAGVAVQLQNSGNLMTYIPGLRPEDGPFESFLAIVFSDGRQVAISHKVAMKSY